MAYDNNRGGGNRRDDKPKELHDAVCADCNKKCQVPFKPNGTKPVTCRECYVVAKPYSPSDKPKSLYDRKPSAPEVDYSKQFTELNFKLDKIVRQLTTLDEQLNPKPEKTRNAPDNTVDHDALKDVIGQVQD